MLFRNDPDRREAVSVITAVIKFLLVLSMVPTILSGAVIRCHIVEVLPNCSLVFRVDGLPWSLP